MQRRAVQCAVAVAACAGIIYDAFYRSFIPTAGQLREDLIAHFCGLDYITEKMIRDAICDAEG